MGHLPMTELASNPLKGDKVAGIMASARDGMAAIEHQQRRVERLLQMPPPAVAQDPVAAQLVAAADAFVVVPGSRLDDGLDLSTLTEVQIWIGYRFLR